ncbi:MAG: YIP1 family protein [Methanoregulaceae archaeon]|nr:YIP1 family protein [Methanoregulaceae archaeon]
MPLLILFIGGVAGAILGYITTGPFVKLYADPGIGMFTTISGIAGGFVSFFISWIVIAAILFLISMAFRGSGTFKRTLEFIGFGMLPQVLGAIISIIIAPSYFSRIVVSPIRSLTDIQVVLQAQNQVLKSPAYIEYQHIAAVLGIIFLLWSANIWIFGLKHSRNISLKHAVITVLVPVVIFAGISLYFAFFGMPFGGVA